VEDKKEDRKERKRNEFKDQTTTYNNNSSLFLNRITTKL
jgi:hypothetical protein